MAETFNDFISRERERLHGEREAVFAEQRELQSKLDNIDRELTAIEAYESAKSGRSSSRQGRMSSAGAPRAARRGSKREDLLRVIRESDGLSRGEILDRMGLKGNKSGEMSVSNALTALTKNGQVQRHGGKYHIGG
ncbi:MAG: hypothetical protein JO001_29945 [Alphaproteobacteria bacterium]|nr:hypothetical protein [Alphaproteobacteria bacterium]